MSIELLGESIKQRRKQLRITQEALAEMVDVSTHFVYEIERGTKIPSLPVMIKIAEQLNTTIDELLSPKGTYKQNDADALDALIKSLSADKRPQVYELLRYLLPKMQF